MVIAKVCFRYSLVIIVSAFVFLQVAAASDKENFARQAEQAGKLREALSGYVAALQELWSDHKHSQELLDKILLLSRKLDPPPVVPEEAKRFMARGRAAVKAAESAADFAGANNEFSTAAFYAPWLAEIYYNCGLVRDKAGKYDEAIWALKMYLQATPGASDTEQVQSLIYEIEYRKEKSQRVKVNEETERLKTIDLSGNWSYRNLQDQNMVTVLNLQGDNVIFPKLISSASDWSLKVNGFELKGTVAVNRHGMISGSCLSSNFDYFKRQIFDDMIVEGKIALDKNHITLRFEMPFIDANKSCAVSYRHKEVEYSRY